jgi:hypothetical protein
MILGVNITRLKTILPLKTLWFKPKTILPLKTLWFKPKYSLRFISSFRRDVVALCALLGYHAALSGSYLPTFRDNLSGPILKGQEIQHPWRWDRYFVPKRRLKNYHSKLRDIPEQRRSYLKYDCLPLCQLRISRSSNQYQHHLLISKLQVRTSFGVRVFFPNALYCAKEKAIWRCSKPQDCSNHVDRVVKRSRPISRD